MDNQLLKATEIFGRNLSLQRKNKNLTQLHLSKELGVHESTISNWEHGFREPNLNMLIMISKFLMLVLTIYLTIK